MREFLESSMQAFMEDYTERLGQEHLWRKPKVRFADVSKLTALPQLIVSNHHMATDFLPVANVAISYFLPFKEEVGQSNIEGRIASEMWARAYLATNMLATGINDYLVDVLEKEGYRAAVPFDTGIISDKVLKSRWSQRHIAFFAGHGTFGLNNMLITEQGCCGRFFSLVARLPVQPDTPLESENCLYKLDGSCGVCVERCVTGALQNDSFDRAVCFAFCMENDARYPGADVCGKCVVALPCSFTCPA